MPAQTRKEMTSAMSRGQLQDQIDRIYQSERTATLAVAGLLAKASRARATWLRDGKRTVGTLPNVPATLQRAGQEDRRAACASARYYEAAVQACEGPEMDALLGEHRAEWNAMRQMRSIVLFTVAARMDYYLGKTDAQASLPLCATWQPIGAAAPAALSQTPLSQEDWLLAVSSLVKETF